MTRHISYPTLGTCSRQIDIELEDGIIRNVTFTGGCHGNTQGIAALVRGMKAADAIARLEGIDCRGKTARQLRPQDAEAFDLFVGMDNSNLRGMRRILGPAAQGRIHLLLEYADRPGQEVADPWYTGDFAAAWADISAGCAGLLRALSPTR